MEVAFVVGGVAVRDSEDLEGSVLCFAPEAWDMFVAGVRAGEFDSGLVQRILHFPLSPMLHVTPDALPRLDIIELDLQDRRKRAEDENWLGEIEGLDLTLALLQRKRAQATRLTTGPIILVGPPAG